MLFDKIELTEDFDTRFFDKLCKKVGYTLKKYALINDGDTIMVGVSGGKDSLFLLESLADRIRHLPFEVSLKACHIHIKEIGYKIDKEYLESLCARLSVPYYFEEISVNLSADTKKTPCFVCSWHRRKRIFELTKELNCNKLALGHHMDDALETLLMNMIYHGSISSMPASLKMFEGRMSLIRPLIELTNEEMMMVARVRQYPRLKGLCPYGDDTKRSEVRTLINNMSEMNKHTRKNLFRSMDRIFPEYLPGNSF
ncbi:MAG TPA: ATP-binding protein [Bacteroidales bacterium]